MSANEIQLAAPVAPPKLGPPWRQRGDWLAVLLIVFVALGTFLTVFAQPPRFDWQELNKRQTRFLHDFYASESDSNSPLFPTKYWTQADSTILIPGLGRGIWQTSLVLNGQRPTGPAASVQISAGDQTLTVQLSPTIRQYHLLTPVPAGDFGLGLRTATFLPQQFDPQSPDQRALGIILNHLAISPVASSSLPPTWAWWQLLGTLLVSYGALRATRTAPRLAIVLPLTIALLLGFGLRHERLAVGLYLPQLVGGVVVAALGVLLARWLWPRLMHFGRIEAPPWLLSGLLIIFLIGFLIKVAGVLYPYAKVIDIDWHMRHTRDILNGQLAQLYQPGAFSESVMPTKEWGAERPVIPYSPFYHIFATVFAIFPWQLETSANVFSVLLDASRVFLIAGLALKWGLRARAAILASLLYAITPFTFLLHSWGNTPTTFGMWWTLVATTIIVLGYSRLQERKVFALLTAVLLATLLFYTVMAVFLGIFVVFFLLLVMIWGRSLPRGSARALTLAFGLASVLSLLIYYGQYIGPIVERTLPYINRTVVGGQQGEGQDVIEPLGVYISRHVLRVGYLGPTSYGTALSLLPLPLTPSMYASSTALWYGIVLPFVVGLPGVWLLRRQRLALLILGAWIGVACLFFLLGTRVSMVDKHLFYVTPALVITTGAVLDQAWQRWRWSVGVIALLYAGTFASALALWLLRLQRVPL